MSSLAWVDPPDGGYNPASKSQRDFIPLIRDAMSEQNIGQRKLALRAGISKTRLGLLLHSDATKRAPMTLDEFQQILRALDINIIQAVITVETCTDTSVVQDQRFATSLAMLTELFASLPGMLIAALDEIEGMDGTEVRKEWAGPLRQAVIEKLVKEVTAVMARRAQLAHLATLSLLVWLSSTVAPLVDPLAA